LYDRIISQVSFTESEAVAILKQLGEAISFLHSKGIVHRDLKPENMLFNTTSQYSPVCIADFGFASFINENETLSTPCGTPGYVAPEIANSERYKKGVDMWSFGVIMYTMLCGFPPFYSDDDHALLDLISEGQFGFPKPWWDGVSESAKDLICRLLETDPTQRYTAELFLSHPWILDGGKTSFHTPTNKNLQGITKDTSTFKKVLNRTIDVQREGAFSPIRAASESTLWMRRQKKKNTISNQLSMSAEHEEAEMVIS